MLKKISVIILTFVILFGISACNVNSGKGNGFSQSVEISVTTETSVTYYHNTFKDKIPEFDFKETPKEQYDDAEGYFFTVTCSEKEFDNYAAKLEKNGFSNNLVKATGYFYAKDSEGYYAELVYKNGILTATVDR